MIAASTRSNMPALRRLERAHVCQPVHCLSYLKRNRTGSLTDLAYFQCERYRDCHRGALWISEGGHFTVEVSIATLGSDHVPGTDVPEPQSLALFGLALAALSLVRGRQTGRK